MTADPYQPTDRPVDPADWRSQALCAQVDAEMFFLDPGKSARDAIAICRRCPVQVECLDYALTNDMHFGVWGGTSERDRMDIRRLSPKSQRPGWECSRGHDTRELGGRTPAGRCRACQRAANAASDRRKLEAVTTENQRQ